MQVVSWRTRAAALAVAGLLLGAGGPGASGQALRTVVMATVNNMNHVPEFVAVEKGLFTKRGVDVKLKVLNSGAETMRAFQGGDAQFVAASPTTLASAWNAGLSLTAVVTIMGDATRVLERKGIPADRITFVNVPAPNHVSVMQSGGVDAEVTWEPYGTMILQQVP